MGASLTTNSILDTEHIKSRDSTWQGDTIGGHISQADSMIRVWHLHVKIDNRFCWEAVWANYETKRYEEFNIIWHCCVSVFWNCMRTVHGKESSTIRQTFGIFYIPMNESCGKITQSIPNNPTKIRNGSLSGPQQALMISRCLCESAHDRYPPRPYLGSRP